MKTMFFVPRLVGLMIACVLLGARLLGGGTEPRLVINHYPQTTNRGVLEWDCPVFAAYKDGTVIWRHNWDQSLDALAEVKSSAAESLVNRLAALIAANDGKKFTLTASSDPEVTTVWFLGKKVEILGSWQKPRTMEPSDSVHAGAINETERKLWATLPSDLREALGAVAAFDDSGSSAWRPAEVAVTLMPAGRALGEAATWPDRWQCSFSDVPGSPGLVRARMPGSMLHELLRELSKDGHPRAVLFGGERKYAQIELIFPGQDVWKK